MFNGNRASVGAEVELWRWVAVKVNDSVNWLNATALYTCEWLNFML